MHPMFTAALFTIAKEATQMLSADAGIETMWSIHTVEYHSAIKRMEECLL